VDDEGVFGDLFLVALQRRILRVLGHQIADPHLLRHLATQDEAISAAWGLQKRSLVPLCQGPVRTKKGRKSRHWHKGRGSRDRIQ